MTQDPFAEELEKLRQDVLSIAGELAASEARYERLVGNAPVGILSMDTEGRILDLNPLLLRILGSPSAEATRNINMLSFGPLIDSGAAANIRRCMEEVKTIVCEHPYTSRWGKELHLRYHLTPILGAEGQVVGAQAVVEDRSEAHRAEAAEALAGRMEAVGTIAQAAARDINDMLGTILGYAASLKERVDPLDPEMVDIKGIIEACGRGRALTGRLFDVAVPSRPSKETVDIAALVTELVGAIERRAPRGIAFESSLGVTPLVEGDPGQLRRALEEILHNALASLGHEGRIRVSTEHLLASEGIGARVRVRVEDDGTGMSPEVLERAMEPFFTTKAREGGAGLGLTMVYGVARNHEGSVHLYSAAGRGTTVTLDLPVTGAVEGPPPHP